MIFQLRLSKFFIIIILFQLLINISITQQNQQLSQQNYVQNQKYKRFLYKDSENIEYKPQKIRITTSNLYDFGNSSKNAIVDEILQVSLKYFMDAIWVFPQQNNIIIQDFETMTNGYQGNCISMLEQQQFQINESEKTTGIMNSDFHIFIYNKSYESDDDKSPFQQHQIRGSHCMYHNDIPIAGYILLDQILLEEPIFHLGNKRSFDVLVQIIQREVFHVLGHTGADVEYFKDQTGKITNDLQSLIHYEQQDRYLKSPHVLQFAQDHFNCQNLNGIHYEFYGRYLDYPHAYQFLNERMTQNRSIFKSTVISLFSLAFLKDSNMFANIDFDYSESFEWGKNQGCNFLQQCDSDQYLEYVNMTSDTQKKCTFDHQGIGLRQNNNQDCNISILQPEYDCTNPSLLRAQSSKTYEYHDFNSKCFESDIIKTGETEDDQLRCYKNQCTSQGVEIILSVDGTDYTILCTFNTDDGAQKAAPTGSGLTGNLQCPEDLNRFCNMPRPCENFCSNKGYCLNQNGKQTCHCIDGYTGSDCSIQCTNLVDLSNNCVDNCPLGEYYEEGSKVCKSCNSCNYCSGPDVSQCRQCPQGQWELDGNCVTDCGDLKFQDKSTGTCSDCSSDCVNGCIQSTNKCLIIPIQYESNKEQAEDRAKLSIQQSKLSRFILEECQYFQATYPSIQRQQCIYANQLADDSECENFDSYPQIYPTNVHEYWSRELIQKWQQCWNHKYSLIKQKCWFFEEISNYYEQIAINCMLFQPNSNIYNYKTGLSKYDYELCYDNTTQPDQAILQACQNDYSYQADQSCLWLEQQTMPDQWNLEYLCNQIKCQDTIIHFFQENCSNETQTNILIENLKCIWWENYQSDIRFDINQCLQTPPPSIPNVPDNPSNPTDPSNPDDPSNPGDPSNPDDPINPDNPGDQPGDIDNNPDNSKPQIKFSNILNFYYNLVIVIIIYVLVF